MSFWFIKTKNDWKVLLLSLLAAATFWFLHAMNMDGYNTTVDYPIEYVYDKDSLTKTDITPEAIQINVTGSGWNLLNKSLGIGMKPIKKVVKKLPQDNWIKTRRYYSEIVEMNPNVKVNFIAPDTLHLGFRYLEE